MRVVTGDHADKSALEHVCTTYVAADMAAHAAPADGLWIDRAHQLAPYLAPIAKRGASSMLVRLGRQLEGALSLYRVLQSRSLDP